MMVKEIKVQGFKEFIDTVTSLDSSSIFCFFSGDKDASGRSWCPDCVTYEPVVRKSLESLSDENAIFIYCSVGGRDYWKNKSNDFRVDKRLKLTGVPTLLKWGNPREKLAEDKLQPNLIEMLLSNQD